MLSNSFKIILLLFFFFFSLNFNAQPYIGITDSTNQWNYRSSIGSCFLSCQSSTYYFSGDTLIGSFLYKKLYKSEVNYFINLMVGACDRDSICSIRSTFVGGLRDDTANRKVYIYDPQIQADTLLYDFDLALGDTLAPTYYNLFYQGNNVFVVDSIGFDTIGLNIHKVFYIGIDSVIAISRAYNLIEGIGGNWGLIYNSIFTNNDTFDCFTNSSGFYPKGISSCNFISSNAKKRKVSLENWSIYPNPTDGELYIPEVNQPYQIRVYNASAKLISNYDIQAGHEHQIEISGPVGIYFLKFIDLNGNTSTTKVVKH